MTNPSTPTNQVAEAIRDAHNEVVFGESNDEAWLRLAQAAVEALKLTEEERSFYDHAEPFSTGYERRLIGPWVSVSGEW